MLEPWCVLGVRRLNIRFSLPSRRWVNESANPFTFSAQGRQYIEPCFFLGAKCRAGWVRVAGCLGLAVHCVMLVSWGGWLRLAMRGWLAVWGSLCNRGALGAWCLNARTLPRFYSWVGNSSTPSHTLRAQLQNRLGWPVPRAGTLEGRKGAEKAIPRVSRGWPPAAQFFALRSDRIFEPFCC